MGFVSFQMESDVLTNFGQTTSVLVRVEAKLVSITGSHLHSRTPLKPLLTLKYYSDLFVSPCRVLDVIIAKIYVNYDNQRHQGNTTLKNFGELWSNYLGTQLSDNSFLFILIKLCKLLHIYKTSDNVYI